MARSREWAIRRTDPGVCSRPVQREAGDTIVVAANPDVVAHSHGRAHALHRGRLIRAAESREGQRLRIDFQHRPARGAARAAAHRGRDVVRDRRSEACHWWPSGRCPAEWAVTPRAWPSASPGGRNGPAPANRWRRRTRSARPSRRRCRSAATARCRRAAAVGRPDATRSAGR